MTRYLEAHARGLRCPSLVFSTRLTLSPPRDIGRRFPECVARDRDERSSAASASASSLRLQELPPLLRVRAPSSPSSLPPPPPHLPIARSTSTAPPPDLVDSPQLPVLRLPVKIRHHAAVLRHSGDELAPSRHQPPPYPVSSPRTLPHIGGAPEPPHLAGSVPTRTRQAGDPPPPLCRRPHRATRTSPELTHLVRDEPAAPPLRRRTSP